MTLVIDMTVNRQEHIATVKVSRLEPLSYDQEIYTYEVELYETRSGTRHISNIKHEYSSGAFSLAQKALEEVQRWTDQRGFAQ